MSIMCVSVCCGGPDRPRSTDRIESLFCLAGKEVSTFTINKSSCIHPAICLQSAVANRTKETRQQKVFGRLSIHDDRSGLSSSWGFIERLDGEPGSSHMASRAPQRHTPAVVTNDTSILTLFYPIYSSQYSI